MLLPIGSHVLRKGPRGAAHTLHDGSGAPAAPARERPSLNRIISENTGPGDRLDMLCGRFVLTPQHDRLLRGYLPPRLVVRAADRRANTVGPAPGGALKGLIALMRAESALECIGGRAMLNALSTAMFALILREASESDDPARGLVTLASNPRLAPLWSHYFASRPQRSTVAALARSGSHARLVADGATSRPEQRHPEARRKLAILRSLSGRPSNQATRLASCERNCRNYSATAGRSTACAPHATKFGQFPLPNVPCCGEISRFETIWQLEASR